VDEEQASLLFHALADATRRDILVHALHQEQSVSGLARRYPVSVTAVQKHVAVLEKAGLVSKEARGRERLVRGEVRAVRAAARLLDHFEEIWRGRAQRIDALLAEDTD
jgi:DNA-binding transcriptional ArsR family regulator